MIMAIDIGSYKICGAIGNITADGSVNVETATLSQSKGFANGRVSDVDIAVQTLRATIADLRRQSPKKISEVWCSLSGLQVNSYWGNATINIPNTHISKHDIDTLIRKCMDMVMEKIPADNMDFLHVLPHMYMVDNLPTKNPEKMTGIHLSAHILMCMGNKTVMENIKSVFEDCNVKLNCIAIDGYMSALSILTAEELAMDFVLCIDMGDLCTSVSLFYKSELVWCKNFAIGSGNVTKKIRHHMAMDTETAENLKKQITAWTQDIPHLDKNRPISYARMGEHDTTYQIPYINLCKIAESEMAQAFKMIQETIPSRFGDISRIVLTGGGNNILGAKNLATHIFKCPVRTGNLQSVQFKIKNSKDKAIISSALLGTMLYSQTHISAKNQIYIRQYSTEYTGGLFSRIWQWTKDNI